MPFRRIRDVERLQTLVEAMLLIEEDLDLPVVLRRIVQSALDMVGARYGALGVLDETGSGLAEFVHVGFTPEQVTAVGRLPEGRGLLGLLIKEPEPLRVDDVSAHPESVGFPEGHPPMHGFLGSPVIVDGVPFGNIYLAEKVGGEPFSAEDEDMLSSLAIAASLAIAKARLYDRVRALTVSEERERIARDLHDTTIKRLFAVGLALQGTRRILGTPEAGDRLQQSIDELDETIRQIRATIFAIARPRVRAMGATLEAEIMHLVEELAGGRDLDVHVEFDGPIDAAVGRYAADLLLLTVREAITDVVVPASPQRAALVVRVDDEGLSLEVSHDGTSERRGRAQGALDAMSQRARLLGGTVSTDEAGFSGMSLRWRATRLQ